MWQVSTGCRRVATTLRSNASLLSGARRLMSVDETAFTDYPVSGPISELPNREHYAMWELAPEDTGLKMAIFVSEKLLEVQHPRLKVAAGYWKGTRRDESYFSITLEENPRALGRAGHLEDRDIAAAKKFVKHNLRTLLAVWDEDVDFYRTEWKKV